MSYNPNSHPTEAEQILEALERDGLIRIVPADELDDDESDR